MLHLLYIKKLFLRGMFYITDVNSQSQILLCAAAKATAHLEHVLTPLVSMLHVSHLSGQTGTSCHYIMYEEYAYDVLQMYVYRLYTCSVLTETPSF